MIFWIPQIYERNFAMNLSLLTRFSAENPCWTEDLLLRAGEDVSGLAELERDGLLTTEGNTVSCTTEGNTASCTHRSLDGTEIFSLTDAGRAAFVTAAAEMFLDERPGTTSKNPARCLMTTELWLELERTNLQRWGLKRYLFRPQIPSRPALPRELVWNVADGLKWEYLDDPDFKTFIKAHPAPAISERNLFASDFAEAEKWNEQQADFFAPDLFYITNYDFQNYLDFRGHPSDHMKLINTDRFVFSAASCTDERLDVLGAMHRWLWTLRRLEIPGWLDVDSHEQDSVNWLIFFTRTQEGARVAQSELKKFGDALIAPVNPMEIWTLSLESLKNCPAHQEVIWDVLPVCGLPVCLTI